MSKPRGLVGAAKGSVLIVDDNEDLTGALRAVLTSPPVAGRFEVRTATRGQEALAIAKSVGFDVAIVDVKLPDVSGVDLIAALREVSPLSEVVLITGFASVDAAIGALRSGAFAFVLKSFRAEELISIVEQALAKVQLQHRREQLERRYRDLVEFTDALVVAVDHEDRVLLFNRKTSAITGVDAEDAVGRPFFENWFCEDARAKMREAFAHIRADGRARDVEVSFADPAGRRRVRWHLSRGDHGSSVPHAGVWGDPTGVVFALGIDVTERRALEKRAADAEAMSAMATLALNLAHEIRNPLNAAVLQLHLLSRDVDKLAIDEPLRAGLRGRAKIVGDEIGRLNRLLTEFLELARPRGIMREPVHIGRLVLDVLDLEKEAAASRGVTLACDVAQDGCVALGDSEKLKQVMINLVVNGLEAMKQGGTLTVGVRCGGDRVVIEVDDTGPGIDPEVLANVFDPFFTTKEAGTGLGLSIVRKIIDQHAGDIHIQSERGRGTKVVVEVPTGR